MAPTLTPLAYLGAPKLQLFDDLGNPAAGYFLSTYEAGTDIPLLTYSDRDGETPNSNPIELDSEGRATVYLTPSIGYKFVLRDVDNALVWTSDNVVDLSTLLFGLLISTDGSKGVTDGYDILPTDTLVTAIGSIDPTDVNLPACTARALPITIKSIGGYGIRINAAGSDHIDGGVLTSITIPSAVSPTYPTITLQSDGVSVWWITAFYGGDLT